MTIMEASLSVGVDKAVVFLDTEKMTTFNDYLVLARALDGAKKQYYSAKESGAEILWPDGNYDEVKAAVEKLETEHPEWKEAYENHAQAGDPVAESGGYSLG